jgi:hypothetical protein
MVALVAASQGLPSLRRSERRAIVAAGAAGIAGLLARPSLLQLKLHRANGEFFAVVATVFVLIALLGVTRLLVRPPADRPPSFSAAYLVALLFFSPVFAFSSPYAAVGGMTVAHGLQYLLLVGLIAGSGGTNRRRAVSVATFCNVALLGGLALSFASHLHRAPGAARLLFGAYLCVVTAHFVVDAGLWRLRDPFPRAFLSEHLPYLVAGPQPAAEAPSPDRSPADI